MSKIAYIGPSGVFGGVRALVEHCNRLAARGHQVTYLVTDAQPIGWLPCRFEQRPAADPGSGYDVVVGSAIPTWPLAAALAEQLGAKSAAVHQMAEWLFAAKGSADYQGLIRAFATPIDVVLPISAWLARLNEQVPGRKVAPIRNGIDPALFYPDPFRDAPAFDGLTLVTEGYDANPAKDIDAMVARAVRHLRYDDGRSVRVWGFSQFPQHSEIFNQFWQTPRQDIIRHIYSSGSVFVKATRYEGRPGPDMEAMACGLPVCRAIGQGGDDLRDGDNCLRVEYGDFDGFLANLRRLLDDAALRERLAAGGLDYVRNHYHWDGAIDRVEEALTGAVSQPQEAANDRQYQYDLAEYNGIQTDIIAWEGPQAVFLAGQLAEKVEPSSVLDLGCGPGNYLVPFKPEARVLGIDGAPDAGKCLAPGEYLHADFREDLPYQGQFDLALCIEVGEHLPPDRADWLVDTLCAHAGTVYFSAAQPGQGGTLHLNERPREWWLAKFAARGYDLHPQHGALARAIADNPHCRRVQWLIGNGMLLWKHDQP